jgi:hypothetical protein
VRQIAPKLITPVSHNLPLYITAVSHDYPLHMWRQIITGKMAKNRSAFNITVSRDDPLYNVAGSQNSPLHMLRCDKSRR